LVQGLEIWYADPSEIEGTGTGYYAIVESANEPEEPLAKLYAVIGDYPVRNVRLLSIYIYFFFLPFMAFRIIIIYF
jgi:hypothetical protein